MRIKVTIFFGIILLKKMALENGCIWKRPEMRLLYEYNIFYRYFQQLQKYIHVRIIDTIIN